MTMAQEPVSSHRNRDTGAVIEVWRAEDMPSSRDIRESKPWITLCVDHGETRFHATRGTRPWRCTVRCHRAEPVTGGTSDRAEVWLDERVHGGSGGLQPEAPEAVFAVVAV